MYRNDKVIRRYSAPFQLKILAELYIIYFPSLKNPNIFSFPTFAGSIAKKSLTFSISFLFTNFSPETPNKAQKMKVTAEKNEKVATMIFGAIYPLYWNRLEKNGRTKEEFHQVLEWFTGFNESKLQELIAEKVTFKTFFEKATIHPNAYLIKGVVCGYRIEEIEDAFQLYKQCRQMEKLIDELAKGRKMEKILRVEKQ